MTFIQLNDLVKSYGATPVVQDFSLTMDKGEFVSLLGPSGCGKTTVLRMLAGFEQPNSGRVIIDGQDVTALRANQRRIGMVFQSYALFPNLTVAANVGFGLKVAGTPKADIAPRVDEMLALVGLAGFGARYPWQLSGGQQQRVALARAIAPRPRVLLLDEPLSALDAKIRVNLRGEIRAIQRDLGMTTLFVTHDQEEALGMSDRVVVMYGGRAEQIGTPAQVYNHPATRFVAGFIGTLNLLDGTVTDPNLGQIALGNGQLDLGRPVDAVAGAKVALAIRPQSLTPHADDAGTVGPHVTATLRNVEFLGSILRLHMRMGDAPLIVDCFNRDTARLPPVGQDLRLGLAAAEVVVLPG